MNENALLPTIPETIRVHLGKMKENAPNVDVNFFEYIANVASNEVYPTFDESALIANILAQTSFALNRYYTEYYKSRGYDFDITSSTSMDQVYAPSGNTFENVAALAEKYFNSYIRRKGTVEPLFASYCDGKVTKCDGMSQFGSQELAQKGLSYFEILQYYYGEDIEIVNNAPIGNMEDSAPEFPLKTGSAGNDVYLLQRRLNRISANFPSIPKINPVDGVFGVETENAVKEFQAIFNLITDGIVGDATWYEVQTKYNAVKKINELLSEGLKYEDVSLQYPRELKLGDEGMYISILQYFLNFVSAFTTNFEMTEINGIFSLKTEEQVKEFQIFSGLEATGIVNEKTWNALQNEYIGILGSLPPSAFEGVARPFGGVPLKVGSEGEQVRLFQEYNNVLSRAHSEIPEIQVDGIFGVETRDAVYSEENFFGLKINGIVDAVLWLRMSEEYNDLVAGKGRAEDQYPGYVIE